MHLNGYKIANPTLMARIPVEELEQFFRGCGWKPYFVEGDEPEKMHQLIAEIKNIQKNVRNNNDYI